jgi:mannose-6-phosphate isomerase-like protein (cupin superfamily)
VYVGAFVPRRRREIRRAHHLFARKQPPFTRRGEPQMTSEPEPTRSPATAEFGRTELQRLSSPIPGWGSVQSLAETPGDVAAARHSHPAPEVRHIMRGDVAIEVDDGATPTRRSGAPFLIPPGVIHNTRNVGSVTERDAYHLRGRRGATPRDQLGLKARFLESGWDCTIPLVCRRKTYKAFQGRFSMFEGFERVRVETEGAIINVVRRGEGPPVLLCFAAAAPDARDVTPRGPSARRSRQASLRRRGGSPLLSL